MGKKEEYAAAIKLLESLGFVVLSEAEAAEVEKMCGMAETDEDFVYEDDDQGYRIYNRARSKLQGVKGL
jgi:hypothetical protein